MEPLQLRLLNQEAFYQPRDNGRYASQCEIPLQLRNLSSAHLLNKAQTAHPLDSRTTHKTPRKKSYLNSC